MSSELSVERRTTNDSARDRARQYNLNKRPGLLSVEWEDSKRKNNDSPEKLGVLYRVVS